jgi:hypothetical protein
MAERRVACVLLDILQAMRIFLDLFKVAGVLHYHLQGTCALRL